jgi:hypothetical protein
MRFERGTAGWLFLPLDDGSTAPGAAQALPITSADQAAAGLVLPTG